MQIMPLFAGALSATAVAAQAQVPCKLSEGENSTLLSFARRVGLAGGHGAQGPMSPGTPVLPERAVTGYGQLYTRLGKCADVKDGNFKSGNMPHVWDCTGNANQQWKVSGNLLRTTNNMCLDVPWGWAYPGAPVQLWACDANNRNQWFETAGNSVRKKGTNFCLDVRDGNYNNGGALQLFSCDWNWAGGNQMFTFNKPAAPQPNVGSPSAFLGYAAISVERFGELHPECRPWVGFFKDAAAGTGLHPTLIAAIAENESTCRERPNNGFGLMQFMDENAFRQFGGGDKQKASDAIWAGARYMRYLLDQNGQNLDAALRAYNGPVSQGGDPNYTRNIRTWMSGGSTW